MGQGTERPSVLPSTLKEIGVTRTPWTDGHPAALTRNGLMKSQTVMARDSKNGLFHLSGEVVLHESHTRPTGKDMGIVCTEGLRNNGLLNSRSGDPLAE